MNLVKQALIYKIAKEQEEKKSWAKRQNSRGLGYDSRRAIRGKEVCRYSQSQR